MASGTKVVENTFPELSVAVRYVDVGLFDLFLLLSSHYLN